MTDHASAPVEIRAGGEDDVETCLVVLNEAYDTNRFTTDWYRWKQLECPFGTSRMWLAEGPAGIDGVFFALPWCYRDGDGPVDGVRTVDGATLPPARGRGVLGALIAHEIRQWDSVERPGVIVATATETARRSHVRNGALALPALQYGYCLPGRRFLAGLDHGEHVLDDYLPDDIDGMGTEWSVSALRWRTDPRSGRQYQASRLRSSDSANGIVYRVNSSRGLRSIVPIAVWGAHHERARLLASVGRASAAPLVLTPVGRGAEEVPAHRVASAGHAWVCVWDRRIPEERHDRSPLASLDGWRLTYGELEGLM